MSDIQEIIGKARELVDKETAESVKPLFAFASETGQELAEKLNADRDIVMLGTLLMDLKLKQALTENKLSEHVQMSLEASKEFLEQFDLSEEIKNKIISCIEEHHGAEKFTCIEAEICANADCYKFLHPKGILLYVCILNERYKGDFKKISEQILGKIEEKKQVLSLDICKEELGPYYQEIQKILEKAGE